MGRPKKIRYPMWLKLYRKIGFSVGHLANKYKVSKRTIWRYLK